MAKDSQLDPNQIRRNPKRRKTRFRAAWRRKREQKKNLAIKETEIKKEIITEIEALKEKYNPDKIGTFKIGSCIGSHSGPGVLGILSFKK